MISKETHSRRYEESSLINADAQSVFAYADNHHNLSLHMNKPSWMMGGGSMSIEIDKGRGQRVGSHIRMNGKAFGINLFLDEVVTVHNPPYHKEWHTIGDINLLVIDHYSLGFGIKPDDNNSRLKVYIYYDVPRSISTHLLGLLFGGVYARWCVKQMINGVKEHFDRESLQVQTLE